MVINTNIPSAYVTRILRNSVSDIGKSVARLASGSKIVSPEDDAAGLAQSSNLQAESVQNKALVTNITNTLSYQRTQDGFLQQVQKAMERMGELVMLASDQTKSDSDRSSYQKEFVELKEALTRIQGKTFNEASLFGSSPNTLRSNWA